MYDELEMNQIRKPRLLFMVEAVTLAQVVRLATLARSLPERDYEIHFASARFDPLIFAGATFGRWPIESVSPEDAERAVAWGLRVHGPTTLFRHAQADRALFEKLQPDLIVSDLRWSLAASAPAAGIPVLSLCNAYWSPHAVRERFPLPDHPLVALLGVSIADRFFPRALPAVFRHFAKPVDALRAAQGLPPLGSLEEVIAWGHRTLYADPPGLVPMGETLPGSHRFLGPVQWTPDLPAPPDSLGKHRPLVYATMGSSGNLKVLPAVLEALAGLEVDVLLATANRPVSGLPGNVHAVPYVRGDLAARRSAVVVSNGGSSTGYQALAEGTPVVGLPWNLDQYLASEAIEHASAGVTVRSGGATAGEVRAAVVRALEDPSLKAGAARVAEGMRGLDAAAAFRGVVDEVLGGR